MHEISTEISILYYIQSIIMSLLENYETNFCFITQRFVSLDML